jgi:hypothetical protein
MLAMGILDGCVYCDEGFADCFSASISIMVSLRVRCLYLDCSNQIN